MSAFEIFLYLAFLFVIALPVRLLSVWNHLPGSDVYGHLLFAKALRDQRVGPYGSITLPMVGAAPYSQPLFWHWVVSHFNLNFILRYQARINACIDVLFVPSVFAIAIWSGRSAPIGLLAALTYLLTPMWFSSFAWGPRIAGFTPRLSSELGVNLFFAVCVLPLGLSASATIMIGGILAWLVISSSKFGMQCLLFVTPLVSLLSGSYVPLGALTIGVLLTLVASRGKMFDMLKAHLIYLASYFRENLRGRMVVSDRNSVRALFKRNNDALRSYLIRVAHRMLRENSYTSVAVKMPVIFVVAYGICHIAMSGTFASSTSLTIPIISASIVFFLVNQRPLLFLGEAERYLNHVAIFISLFAAEFSVNHGLEWLLGSILIYGLVFWGIEVGALLFLKPKFLKQRAIEDKQIIGDLNTLPPTNVLAYPYECVGGSYRIGLQTDHLCIYSLEGAFTEINFTKDFNQRFSDGYPYVQIGKLDEMADEYGIGYVIVDRRTLELRGLGDWKPSARWKLRAVGGEVYSVYSSQP